ncbi:MAG: repeat-like domain, partial [Thermoplasmata archaeon]|nr:repeat-like domain [Thermoplasmata archaeon]
MVFRGLLFHERGARAAQCLKEASRRGSRVRAALPVALGAFLLLSGCFGNTTSTSSTSPAPPTPERAFSFSATQVDATLDVSEPSILSDPAGTLWVAGPTGFAKAIVEKDPSSATHDSALFKSTDHGATWSNVQQIPMYGRDPCPGGGDSDIAAAPDGALYLIDLNLGNVPIDVSTDGGKTWVFNCNSSVVPGVDRQWVAATNAHVWISVNQLEAGPIVYRSDSVGGSESPLVPNGLVFGPPKPVAH